MKQQRPRLHQAELFEAPTELPRWLDIPTDARRAVIELVARMLSQSSTSIQGVVRQEMEVEHE